MITVIGTSPDRAKWACDALGATVGDAVLVSVPGFELGKIRWIIENTNIERFLFIQDSVLLSEAFYGRLSAFEGSVALLSDPRPFGCYLGVYERDVLLEVGFPHIGSKLEAVQAEIWWTAEYCATAGEVPVLFPEVKDSNPLRVEHLFGRDNLVLGNEYFTKYKGTWRYDQIVG